MQNNIDFEVITGPMFSGKTSELLRLLEIYFHQKRNVQIFLPDKDTREFSEILKTHSGQFYGEPNLVSILDSETPNFIKALGRVEPDIILIDEVQFFSDLIIDEIQKYFYHIKFVVAGLSKDYQDKPFGPMPKLLALADVVTKLKAVCKNCRDYNATFTYRENSIDSQILIGGEEIYSALCKKCYFLKMKVGSNVSRR